MPKLLTTSGSNLKFLIPIGGRDCHALTQLIVSLNAPSDLQGVLTVTRNAVRCVYAFLNFAGISSVAIWDYAGSLNTLSKALQHQEISEQPMACAGRKVRFCQWTLLHNISDEWESIVLAGIGAELVRALLMQQAFQPAVARHITSLGTSSSRMISAQKLALKLIKCANAILDASNSTSTRELKTNSLILSSISSQLNSMRIVQRQAAGGTFELTDSEVLAASRQLKENADSGCLLSLQIITCYCLGLPWDVALDVPFSNYVRGDWVAQIDVFAGVSKIDLEPCFPSMAQGHEGHIHASPVLVRPFPQFSAKLLHSVISKNLNACCLRKLNDIDIKSTAPIPGMISRGRKMTIAKFIGSRGTQAMGCGLDRSTAAYVAADFTKIGKSKNYYSTFSATEIWNGSASVYEALGWGNPVPMESNFMLGMGSRATPTEATVVAIDKSLQDNLSACRAGKKYTQVSIDAHTNAFSLLCAHRIAFFSLGRAAKKYGFYAGDFVNTRSFQILVDKRVGPHQGKTPLPIPTCTMEQVKLWLAHLEIYDSRLCRLGVQSSSNVRTHIRRILDGEDVSLFFRVGERGNVIDIGSSEISALLPNHLRIKFDFARHYLQNKLRQLNVPQNWIDAAARHHVDGTSVSYATANIRQIQWLSEVASQIDLIALSLGFLPVAGLGRGRSK